MYVAKQDSKLKPSSIAVQRSQIFKIRLPIGLCYVDFQKLLGLVARIVFKNFDLMKLKPAGTATQTS